VEFRILGPLQVWHDGCQLDLGPAQQRAVLALLLLHRGAIASADRLVDDLWGDRPPASAVKILQNYISQLRRVLPAETIVTHDSGYLIHATDVDADEFTRLVDDARRQDARTAAETLQHALALWRGPPLADFAYHAWAEAEIARLSDLRLAALEERIDADLNSGKASELVPELEALTRQYPLRERLRAQLMLALYRAGRQTEALDTYADVRRRLVDGLGIEPSPDLRQLQQAILVQDPALGGSSRSATAVNRDRLRSTIRDVASAAGVSIATVSRVLNGRPDVATDTRETVLRAVKDLGFTTNRSARSLSGARTFTVGVRVPLIDEYFSGILGGAADALHEQDIQFVLALTLHLRDRAAAVLERFTNGATDGALLILPEQSSNELDALVRSGYPFVIVDPLESLHEGVPTVSSTNALGGRVATEHLLALGHRRIGVITGVPDWLASVERLSGYRAAHAAAGVLPDPSLVAESDWSFAGGEAAAAALLERPDPPTSIFAFNDIMAVGVMRAAHAHGLRVPHDLSVVGFDDQEHAKMATPTLTTVRQPLAEMGRMAVSLLIRQLENRQLEGLRIELQTRLVARNSTAAARVQKPGVAHRS
jgi:LacI family transcriptional regulator